MKVNKDILQPVQLYQQKKEEKPTAIYNLSFPSLVGYIAGPLAPEQAYIAINISVAPAILKSSEPSIVFMFSSKIK